MQAIVAQALSAGRKRISDEIAEKQSTVNMMRAMFNKGKQAAGGGTYTEEMSEPWIGMAVSKIDPTTGKIQYESQ